MWRGKQYSMIMKYHIVLMKVDRGKEIYDKRSWSGFFLWRRVRGYGGARRMYTSYLLFLPQGKKANTRYFHNLKAYSGNITLSFATATETRNEDLIVLVHKVQTTIILSRCQYHGHGQLELLTGTKAVTFFPFLISCTRTHLRMAELGCLASTPTFSRTMPFAWEEPPVGDVL